jgi:hypothetical protein
MICIVDCVTDIVRYRTLLSTSARSFPFQFPHSTSLSLSVSLGVRSFSLSRRKLHSGWLTLINSDTCNFNVRRVSDILVSEALLYAQSARCLKDLSQLPLAYVILLSQAVREMCAAVASCRIRVCPYRAVVTTAAGDQLWTLSGWKGSVRIVS